MANEVGLNIAAISVPGRGAFNAHFHDHSWPHRYQPRYGQDPQ